MKMLTDMVTDKQHLFDYFPKECNAFSAACVNIEHSAIY